MTDLSSVVDEEQFQPKVSPERLAWGVLLISFAIFCFICAASTLGVYYFMFDSSLSLQATLNVGRGTVGVTEGGRTPQAVSGARGIEHHTIVQTDSADYWSQANIDFIDPNHNQVIASLVVRHDSSIELQNARRPRFDWSNVNYEVSFGNLTGQVDLFVFDTTDRPLDVDFSMANGTEIRINSPGRYLLESVDGEIRLTNWTGQAVLIAPDRVSAVSIPAGQIGLVDLEGQILRYNAPINFLENGDLTTSGMTQPQAGVIVNDPVAGRWSCTHRPNTNLPLGNYFSDLSPDGRDAFRLVRGGGATTNAQTSCEYSFPEGLDISNYNFIALQAAFYLKYHSVNGCGEQGSECPMMFKIQYTDVNGIAREWIHGVYYLPFESAQNNWKRRCDTCISDNIRINSDTWYIYNSDNLFNVIPPDQTPQVINRVIFFAEGHQYDVYIDEIALIADPVADESE